jgi:hypothetical protein
MASPYVKQTWLDIDPSTPPSAQRMGVVEQGVVDAHTSPAVRAYARFSVTGNPFNVSFNPTWTSLSLHGEAYDTDSMRDPNRPGRITIQTPGVYLVTASVSFFRIGSDSAIRWIQVIANISTVVAATGEPEVATSTAAVTISQVSAQRRFAAGDYLELAMYSEYNSGPPATQPTQPTDPSSTQPFLSAVWLAP